MATKEQFDFFKSQYDEENSRSNELTKRAEIYLSIISLFLTAVLFKVKDIFDSTKELPKLMFTITFILGLLSFSITLFYLINTLKIQSYEGALDLDDFIKKNDTETQSNEDFFEDRVADFIVAIQKNEELNNIKADNLILARWFLLFGFIFTIVFIIELIILKFISNG